MNLLGKRFLLFCLLAAAGVCFTGCGKTASKKTETDPKPEVKKDGTWDGKLEIVVGNHDDYQKLVASHKGKVVVTDLWSTWCEPCLRELPNLAALQQKHGEKIVCIAVGLDYEELKPGDPEVMKKVKPAVEKALRKKFFETLGSDGSLNAEFRLFIANENSEKFTEALKATSVPTLFIYDKDGKPTMVDINSAGGKDPTYEKHVNPVVDKLLK